ncbi:hypothetical protein KOW79_022679 [Hemibagrus wyckioides]|uniref:Uncharacterized protein n=1 Tax=Hemibagrus wyckioides TaxID=337641 RepID=A0A9D3N0R3_9TELE|nr:hypothetical protein KOW79_022679 [Hemibagrus wyckioides]
MEIHHQSRLSSAGLETRPELTLNPGGRSSVIQQQDYLSSVWLSKKEKMEHSVAPGPSTSQCTTSHGIAAVTARKRRRYRKTNKQTKNLLEISGDDEEDMDDEDKGNVAYENDEEDMDDEAEDDEDKDN